MPIHLGGATLDSLGDSCFATTEDSDVRASICCQGWCDGGFPPQVTAQTHFGGGGERQMGQKCRIAYLLQSDSAKG